MARRWYAESWGGQQPAPPPISKPEEPTDRCTHGGYLRESTSDPITHTPPLCVLSSARPANPRSVPSALECETCIDYPIPLLIISEHRTATFSYVPHEIIRHILCRGCFNLGLIAPAILPLASLTNALVSDCQAYLSVPVPMTCQARIGCPHRLLIYCYVSVMKAAVQQVALFIVSQIRKGDRNEAGRARYSSNQEEVKKKWMWRSGRREHRRKDDWQEGRMWRHEEALRSGSIREEARWRACGERDRSVQPNTN